jgi:NADPH-dependent glutamate synthase beta chain and related oxidoreductases
VEQTLGSAERPVRVAIIGAGPSAFYAADGLLQNKTVHFAVDMFDRKPTPFGLVRDGVAPDHQKIKSVTRVYDKTASHPRYRFFGNVTFGRDITLDDLKKYYDQIIFAVGAQSDRRMGVPGEDLEGSYPATVFVAWYNGHIDYSHLDFDLSQESVAIIGQGNVAIDVTRILAKSPEELAVTDIADHALERLRHSKIKKIYVIGRRGPAQAAFTNVELRELGELDVAELIVNPAELELDPASEASLANDRVAAKNVEILRENATKERANKERQIEIRFLRSPVEVIGENGKVTAIKLQKNILQQKEDGSIVAVGTDEYEILPVGLVFRSIGYKGAPLEGVPYDDRKGTIPNTLGRIINNGEPVVGQYVVGWAKRGPSGIIGTNKPDSLETVKQMVADLEAGVITPASADACQIEELLKERNVRYVSFAEWKRLDEVETSRGQAQGRPRVKFTKVKDMLDHLDS